MTKIIYPIRVITIHEPYASALVMGVKHCETRNTVLYQGLYAIYAAPQRDDLAMIFTELVNAELGLQLPTEPPLGCMLGICNITRILVIGNKSKRHWIKTFGIETVALSNFGSAEYAHIVQMVEVFEQPIPVQRPDLWWDGPPTYQQLSLF